MSGVMIAFWFFLTPGYAIFTKIWFDARAISPVDPLGQSADFQAIHYWKTYRKHYLTEASVGWVIVAFLILILAPFFFS